jgi:hypothetical protein
MLFRSVGQSAESQRDPHYYNSVDLSFGPCSMGNAAAMQSWCQLLVHNMVRRYFLLHY